MKITSFLLVGFLALLPIKGSQTRGAILISSVVTTGTAKAVFGSQSWDERDFGGYSGSYSWFSTNEPTGDHTASSSVELSYDELTSTIRLAGTADAHAPTQLGPTYGRSLTEIQLQLDRSYSFSLSGFDGESGEVWLTRDPEVHPFFERYRVGGSGTIGPGTYKLQGQLNAQAFFPGGPHVSDSYSATLTLDAAPVDGDFDNDDDVDGQDFLTWQRNPGVGNLSDWQANYGTVASLSANSRSVPEPSSLVIIAFAVSLLCFGKRLAVRS